VKTTGGPNPHPRSPRAAPDLESTSRRSSLTRKNGESKDGWRTTHHNEEKRGRPAFRTVLIALRGPRNLVQRKRGRVGSRCSEQPRQIHSQA